MSTATANELSERAAEPSFEYGEVIHHEAAFEDQPPEWPASQARRPWQPKGGPLASEVFLNRTSKTKFLYGERASGKTNIALNDMLIHCHQDFDPEHASVAPLAVMATIVRGSATTGGSWDKLINYNLPEWAESIGLEYTTPRMDDQKNRYLFVGNKTRGWSRIVLKSMPYGENIQQRLKNVEASYFFFDEITETNNPDYYNVPLQSLRLATGGPRQYMCAGNPSDLGEEHWTWQLFVKLPSIDNGYEEPILPTNGGRIIGPDESIAVYHIPMSENVFWDDKEKADYLKTILQQCRIDPTVEDRYIRGLWVPRPSGRGLFKNYFMPDIHVKGDANKGVGIMPIAGWPVYVGYDLGMVNNSVTFMQSVLAKDGGIVWLVFDEIDYIQEEVPYTKLANETMQRMKYWREAADYPFKYIHIADSSAINQYRPSAGSYDASDFEKAFRKQWPGERTRLIGCPKGRGSVGARVRLLQSCLQQVSFMVSAVCTTTINMLRYLVDNEKMPGNPKRSKWVHKFDSLTYPMFWVETNGRGALKTTLECPKLLRYRD